jgi:GGDEF domain-containing protein
VTLSAGIGRVGGGPPDAALRAAQDAAHAVLYRAKEQGRDRLAVAD